MSTYEPGTHTRCHTCETLFTNEALNALPPEEQGMCPACGTHSVPHDPALDVTLTLNWHDLRCLVIWAENYVMASKADQDWERAWEAIKRRIKKHRPAGAVGLTLLDEIEDIRAEGYNVTLHEGKMNRPDTSEEGGMPSERETERQLSDMQVAMEEYREITDRLQQCVQRHRLGLGGERIDVLVCDEVDRLRAAHQERDADARRLDWLEGWMQDGCFQMDMMDLCYGSDSVRAAIDAAMAADTQTEGVDTR